MPFNSRLNSATSAKKMQMDVALADVVIEGLVEMDSRSLTVAAEDPASLAALKSAVIVELAGKNSLGLADDSILGALDKVKGVVCYFALELFDTSRGHSCSSGRPWMSL
eukprot:2448203-Pleurochrysis_carterae.AAC.1